MQDRVADPSISRQLVERIRVGDRTAETELWHKYSKSLMFILKRTGDATLAQDALQECFRIALVQLRTGSIDNPDAVSSYLRSIALHVLSNLCRVRGGPHDDVALENLVADERSDPLNVTHSVQLRKIIGQLIAELKVERDRQLLWRHYVLDHAKDLLCRDLDLSAEHFDRVLHRARIRLRTLAEQAGLLESPRHG